MSSEAIGEAYDCLGPETLARASSDLANDPERDRIEAHAARCASCREILSALADTGCLDDDADTLPSPRERTFESDVLPPGTTIGRYVVLKLEARGGMGVVYQAHDPELDRKVALKLLRPDRITEDLRQEYEDRLRREARSLAQLQHPNVVAAYDVGQVDGQIFVAMEFVEGQTLAGWLREESRPWREVLARFLEAARGLAAAHAAGLVHRDFKPENVLIGADARVRVADFGLARISAKSNVHDQGDPLALALTNEGLRLGTPTFMSPEQLRGQPVDEKSDQFSFCVALYSGLYGQFPFDGIARDRVEEPPRGTRVPRRIWRALLRGMSLAPADRFPSMDALIRELERDPGARRRRALGFALALLSIATAAGIVQHYTDAGRLCRGAERRLEGTWDSARRIAIARALRSTGAPYAEATFREVSRAFDAFASAWVAMHQDACEATRVRGEQTEEVLGLRMSCLEGRMREMRALGDRFVEADRAVAENAIAAVQHLSDLSACADLEALTSPIRRPSDPATLERVQAIEEELARVRSFEHTGRYQDALEPARALAKRAEAIGYRPLEAEAFHLLGVLADEMGDFEDARKSLERAVWCAEAGRHDEIAARAWIRLIRVIGERSNRDEEARAFVPRVTAALERSGGDDEIEASLLSVLASIALIKGRYADAERDFAKSLALLERRFGEHDLRLTEPLRKLAFIAAHRDESDRSLVLLNRALEIQRKVYRDEHPEIAMTLETIANAEYMAGRYHASEAAFKRALEIREKTLGKEHLSVANTMHNLGVAVYLSQGRVKEAIEMARKAVALDEKLVGPEHPNTLRHLHGLALALETDDQLDESLAILERVLPALEKQNGSEHPIIAEAIQTIAGVKLKLKQFEEARALAMRSHEMNVRMLGPDYNSTAVHRLIGRTEIGMGQPARAIEPLSKARAQHLEKKDDPAELAWTTSLLGQALYDSRRDRAKGIRLVREARAYMLTDPRLEAELEELTLWMRKRQLL